MADKARVIASFGSELEKGAAVGKVTAKALRGIARKKPLSRRMLFGTKKPITQRASTAAKSLGFGVATGGGVGLIGAGYGGLTLPRAIRGSRFGSY